MLVATKLVASIPCLPGGGCVYTVGESQWVKIGLLNPVPVGKGEGKNVVELMELDVDGKYFFCESRDITRPFPSRMPVELPDEEFVWNRWFSLPFKDVGLPQHCVILLQGFVERRVFGSSGQQEGVVALTARRSRLHPGTRYLARGLNACSGTGNEVECEQLVWVPKKPGQSVAFNTYIWRRGTIPIWWGAELKMTSAEAEIYVSARDPYKGSPQYYQRLSTRYRAPDLDVNSTGNQKKSSKVPIVCINLLRYGEGRSESILVQHFVESINYIKSTGKLPHTQIHLVNYDWHASTKLKGEQQTIEGLWKLLKGPAVHIDICEGDYLPSRQRLNDCKGEIICIDGLEGAFCLRSHQHGVIRFNCADSLDRTNAASYFGALQVFVEQCRRLGVSLDTDLAYGYSSSNNYGGYIAPLPRGWEKRSDAVTGKTYYIDHNTRTTTWVHPCPDKPWKRFDMSFEEFKRSTILSPISQLADIFLLAGDIHATLYTGSKAMHSQILNIFTEEPGKFKQFSVAQNVKITLQRRYKNVVVDSSRQKQLEMFLGMRLFRHLPSLSIHPLRVLSRPSSCFLKPVTKMIPSINGGADLLSFKRKDEIWVCAQAADVLELFIYLGEPCHVCQLLLTISHGTDDSTYPASVDVRTGRNLDGLKLVLEGASIPKCVNGTNLLFPLAGAVNPEDMAVTGGGTRLHAQETPSIPLLYDFEELEGELDFLTRVVALTFYPAVTGKAPLTLGEIEVLGVSLPWRDIFTKEGRGLKFSEAPTKIKKDTNLSQFGSDTNPFANASISNENVLSIAPQGSPGSLAVDLLTGDFDTSESIFQPKVSGSFGNVASGADGLLDFLDDAVADDKGEADSEPSFSPNNGNPMTESGVQHYTDCFKVVFGPHMSRNIDFEDAMKLEIERIRMNLSAAERDRALLQIGTDPARIDPNGLLDASYMSRLCKVANQLALLGQAALEDKVTAALGLDSVSGDINDDCIDFWNITGIGETCYGNRCEVRAISQPSTQVMSTISSGGVSSPVLLCSQCERKVCKVCCAGKGALLLSTLNSKEVSTYSGSVSRGSPADGVSTNYSTALDGVICKSCCNEIVLDALLVDYARVLISTRRVSRADRAAYAARDEVVALHSCLPEKNEASNIKQVVKKVLGNLLNGEESLAEFPFASLLHSVKTATGSQSPMSLLAPLDAGSQNSYWRAPPSVSSIEFSIVLGGLSDVSGVVLLVSSCGYSPSDTPIVQIWASNKINKEERSLMGKWDIQSLITSTPELYGPEKAGGGNQVPRHLKFTFRNPVRCRMIWVTLRLQHPGSNSVNLDKSYSLLSLEENPFAGINRRASFGGTVDSDPYLHAKRLMVVGSLVRDDLGLESQQSSDEISVKQWLERGPQLNRFKVPIEVERLADDDRVLEQYLLPTSPELAGFRLDAFSAIRPRVTHAPFSEANIWDDSLTWLEERHIHPAVLFIQVSALQEPHNVFTIGEYRLPVTRAGTPMYFDFPRPVQARRITFKLLGDVAVFADEASEQDTSDSRLASGLSLSNRIKLYYYADPYDLGKWASLSAV